MMVVQARVMDIESGNTLWTADFRNLEDLDRFVADFSTDDTSVRCKLIEKE
jgi:hypothetical protein